jgi:thymidylate synthase ThyX
MTQISAKIIADSKNQFGNRITTMLVTFPRYILAELNTHRMLSKNSASSRAIPFEKMVKSVEENPFIPIAWQKDHKGMQGTEYFTKENDISWLIMNQIKASKQAIERATDANERGLTKQLCNRYLEPFMWHTVLITATEWENFFYLRCPQYNNADGTKIYRSKKDMVKDIPTLLDQNPSEIDWLKINKGMADIHMMALAEAMWDAYNESTPKELKAGEWHIPFGDDIILDKPGKDGTVFRTSIPQVPLEVLIATARAARTSYTVIQSTEEKLQNDEPISLSQYEKDIILHDRLAKSGHWSCFEHCAKAMNGGEYHLNRKVIDVTKHNTPIPFDGLENGWLGNFRGFIQYRKMFENENKTS